eukprot:TRINITY_DN849_c0_g3_i2.p2 TRINITY_DN849_c0_g3~~TRINITY_DN849_c0_g3_i2.p2  ORF type:complete len:123 (-),score=47.12 TRINITY_DN849_c0_g3_i2:137-505(-)
MGHCLGHHEAQYRSHNPVYDEKFKFKATKDFCRQREEDRKKQVEDSGAQFAVLVRAKTAKKKISTVVKPDDIALFQQAINKAMKASLLKNVEFRKEERDAKKRTRKDKGEITESEGKKFKSK